MQEPNSNLYSIQFVSNITGINPHTIRAWEKRYGATSPIRDKNGRRLYSDMEINRLDVLQKLVTKGNNISDIAKKSKVELEEILNKYSVVSGTTHLAMENRPKMDIEAVLKNIHMSIKFFKLDVLSHELQKASFTLSGLDLALNIVNPIISEIRKQKGSGDLLPEQREQLYILLKSYLTKKIFHENELSGLKKKILVASAPGQLNELGSMVAAIFLQSKKYEVEYLGGNVNAKVLAKLSNHFDSDAIFLGLNYSHDVVMSLADKNNYLKTLAQELDSKTKVMVGAYDYCFKLPNANMECFNNFNQLNEYLSDLN